MGDRCIIVAKDSDGLAACAVYLHWAGGTISVLDLLSEAARYMDDLKDDAGYATARLIGIAHARTPGNLSLGVIEAPTDERPATLKEYSHGDAGVIVWDTRDDTVRAFGGYIAEEIGDGETRKIADAVALAR